MRGFHPIPDRFRLLITISLFPQLVVPNGSNDGPPPLSKTNTNLTSMTSMSGENTNNDYSIYIKPSDNVSHSNDNSTDEKEELLHSGLLASDPDSESSGSTVPFHKLNYSDRYRRRNETKFRRNFSDSDNELNHSQDVFGILPNDSSHEVDRLSRENRKDQDSDANQTAKKPSSSQMDNASTGTKNKNNSKNSRRKRQVNIIGTDYVSQGRRRNNVPSCNRDIIEEETIEEPLSCYQCFSYHQDKHPLCDTRLWRHLRRSEKDLLRIRCPQNRGHYCVKSVGETKHNIRKTIRGCMGPGPLKTNDGKHVDLREGCISYIDGDYSTTTCFCQQDLCNKAPGFGTGREGSFISALIVIYAVFVYAFCYIAFSR